VTSCSEDRRIGYCWMLVVSFVAVRQKSETLGQHVALFFNSGVDYYPHFEENPMDGRTCNRRYDGEWNY
jgi:hypothetical protein